MSNVLKAIRERHSTRGPFDVNRPIARPELKQILEAAQWAPTPHNMQNFEILLVDDRDKIDAIRNLPVVISEYFLRENYRQLSFSQEELEIKKKGVLANIFPRAWTNPEAWNPECDYRSQTALLSQSMSETPLLLIVLFDASKRAPGSVGDFLGHLGLGCVLENLWLASESLAIGFRVLSIFNTPEAETKIETLLRIPSQLKIAFACSLGYPAEPGTAYPRVRRSLENFVHHNQYGHQDVAWSRY